MNRCFLCMRKMLNEFQCSNSKCERHILPPAMQAEAEKAKEELSGGDQDEPAQDKKGGEKING